MFDDGGREFESLSAALLADATGSDSSWAQLYESGWWALGSDPASAGPFQGHELPTPAGVSAVQWDARFTPSGSDGHLVFDAGSGRAVVARSANGDGLAIAFAASGGASPHYGDFQDLIASLNRYIADNHITTVIVTGRDLGAAVASSFLADHPDDGGVHYAGLAAGAAAGLWNGDPRVATLAGDQPFEAPGSHALVPIETAGNTTLNVWDGTYYQLANSSGGGGIIRVGFFPVLVSDNLPWVPIGAEQVGSNYEIVWRAPGTDQYIIWLTDLSTGFLSGSGVVTGTSAAIVSREPTFLQDLNGDGLLGLPTTVIETAGATDLVQVGRNYFLVADGALSGPQLVFNGTAVTNGMFGDWAPIGVEAISGGYEVAWKNGSQHQVWLTDGSGNYIGQGPTGAAGSLAIQSIETSFQQDLNGDGTTGVVTSVLESSGSTSLIQKADHYYVRPTGGAPDIELSAFGAPVFAGQFGAFVPIAAEATAGGYQVAWKATGLDQYTVLNADGAGVFQSHSFFVVSGNSLSLQSIEPNFQQDLNGDTTIGVVTSTVEASGLTALSHVADTYFLNPTGGGTGPQLKFGGAAVTDGQFGGWAPIGAELVGGGYRVTWKFASSDQYQVWTVDGAGNYVSGGGALSGGNYALQTAEVLFQQNFNGDAVTGLLSSTIESSGTTTLSHVADTYFLNPTAGGTGPQLRFGGAAVTDGQFGGWAPIGAEQVGTGYRVAWKLSGADQYQIWTVDGGGNYLSSGGALSGASSALQSSETLFQEDLNGDSQAGLVSSTIETSGATALAHVANTYFLNPTAGGTGPLLRFAGAAVTDGQFGGWAPIGAEQVGAGYRVAWKLSGADQYQIWSVDGGGNYLSSGSAVSGGGNALQATETLFQQDLNGDSQIGLAQITIEASNAVELFQMGGNYYLDDGSTTKLLTFGGRAVEVGQFGAWSPIGVDHINQGYEMVWRIGSTDQYQVWNLDGNGAFHSNYSGVVSGSSWIIRMLEGSLMQDLNGDSQTGLPTSPYDIEIDLTGDAGYWIFFEAAARRWEQVITADVPDVFNPVYGFIDDLRIAASVTAIDGPGNVLGSAGPDYIRSSSGLPTHGNMQFDSADLASMANNGTLFSVVLHEIGHVLGLGSLWSYDGLSSGSQYTGQYALAAYRQLSGNPSATFVPLETTGGPGTAGVHWSEALFGNELMTGYISGVPALLSSLTIGGLRDLGYTVNTAQAEAYTMPGHLVADSISADAGESPGGESIVGAGPAADVSATTSLALDMPLLPRDQEEEA